MIRSPRCGRSSAARSRHRLPSPAAPVGDGSDPRWWSHRPGSRSAVGRWSLVEPAPPRSLGNRALLAQAHQLLDRYGVLARSRPRRRCLGGFAGVPVLKGSRSGARCGILVAGLEAAQFALPGAVDRLRAVRQVEQAEAPVVLAATDPAQPYGAAVTWPESSGRPARSAGAHVVLIDGDPIVLVERGGRSS